MITTLDYARMANAVYNIDPKVTASPVVARFEMAFFEEGMSWGLTNTDFKGCVYLSGSDKTAVVALQGTVPRKGGDLFADLQIGIGAMIGMLPQYCSAAHRLLDRTQSAFPGHDIVFVGHSLGGGVAQVLGHWTGFPFVTFNAPGMWTHIQTSKLVPWSPSGSWKSIKGTFKGPLLAKQAASTGRNFRNVLDPVSAYGAHYGPVTRFWGADLHSMDSLVKRIESDARWRDADPLDPASKEWGEL
jgi:hypothetical protein